MILLKGTQSLALPLMLLGIATAASATEDSRIRTVIKSDGSMGQYQLLPVHHDAAHAAVVNARLARLATAPLPDHYSIPAASLPVVRDQGQRGTCAYFATVGILEAYYMAQSPKNSSLTLSEECLVDVRNWEFDQTTAYTGADQPTQRPDPNGDLPASIILTVAASGVPTATKFSSTVDCTYDGANTNGNDLTMDNYLSTFTQSTGASIAYGKGLKIDENTAPTIDTVRGLIASGVPVEIGIVVYNEYMSETDWRFDAKQDTADNIAGGHAIILTGYTTKAGKTIFTFKNSWGDSWGNAGYGTIDDGILTNAWGYDPSYDFITSIHS